MAIDVVTPSLLVGPAPYERDDYEQLLAKGVTAILSLQTPEDLGERTPAEVESAAKAAHLTFRNVPVNDFDRLDLKRKLMRCVQSLHELVMAGHTVYVHCTAGVTRSPTVVAAYLHVHLGSSIEEAVERLREVRRCSPEEDVLRLALPAKDGV